jgi:hypothetical protein
MSQYVIQIAAAAVFKWQYHKAGYRSAARIAFSLP